jgi:hypothetical protein
MTNSPQDKILAAGYCTNGESLTCVAPFWMRATSIIIVAVAWLFFTAQFWVGYVGTDDIFYTRYAFLLHRPPTNWWEFRIPFVLAVRASFLAFGPSEFAAALPTLVASLVVMASVACFVGWPRAITWKTNSAMLLAATMPMDVAFRSVPGAPYFATAFLVAGTVCMITGRRLAQLAGALLLAVGFVAHEVSVFYIAALCATAVVCNRTRYFWPALACVIIAGLAFVLECVIYETLLDDAFARFRTAAATSASVPVGFDPDTGIGGVRFFTWPLETLIFCKAFGANLLLLLVAGIVSWKTFTVEQRIVFVAMYVTWAWLGFGTQVPWSYKPLYRQMHYYGPLIFGIASLLPVALWNAFERRRFMAKALIVFAIVSHCACIAAGGRWGEDVEVSRALLEYAHSQRDKTFVTDVETMNQMYALGGFQLPGNVVCINGPAVEKHLRLNKEPPGAPRFRFAEIDIDGILVNLERIGGRGIEAEFQNYLSAHPGQHKPVAPVRWRPIFYPLVASGFRREFMVRSLGGEVVDSANGIAVEGGDE